MKRLTRLLSWTRRWIPISKARKEEAKARREEVKSLYARISSLPNELVIPILRNIYPLEIFIPYNKDYNKDTEEFWRDVLKADVLMSSISGINERFRDLSDVILKELVSALGFKAITIECRGAVVQPAFSWECMIKTRIMAMTGRSWMKDSEQPRW